MFAALAVITPPTVVMAAVFGFGISMVLWTLLEISGVRTLLVSLGVASSDSTQILVFDLMELLILGTLGIAALLAIPLWVYLVRGTVRTIHDELLGMALPADKRDDTVLSTVEDLADRAGTAQPSVAVIDTEQPGTYACGWNDAAIVAVTTGLVEMLRPEELETVLAHQLSQVDSIDARAIGLALTAARYTHDFTDTEEVPLLGVVVNIVFAPLFWTSQFGIALLETGRKTAADSRAVALTDNPRALADALERLQAQRSDAIITADSAVWEQQMAIFDVLPPQGRSITGRFSTHPPTEERVARLRRLADEE